MLWGVQWYYWLILLAAVVGAVFLWHKALKTSRERQNRLKAEGALWERESALRHDFAFLTEEKVQKTPPARLLAGTAMNIQLALENEADMSTAYLLLPTEKRVVYTLEYFDEDASKSLSQFYRANGAPLSPFASSALHEIGYSELLPILAQMFPMFDEDSLVSVNPALISKLDCEFSALYDRNRLYDLTADYIKKHKQVFLT